MENGEWRKDVIMEGNRYNVVIKKCVIFMRKMCKGKKSKLHE